MQGRQVLTITVLSLGCWACGGRVISHVPTEPLPARAAAPLVQPGTRVEIHLEHSITTGRRGNVDAGRFVVTRDVTGLDGAVALPAGSPVVVAMEERPQGPLGREGILRVRLVGAVTPAGELVPLTGEGAVHGIARRGLAAGLTIGMFFVYFPFNFLHLLHRGTSATLPDGYTVHAVVSP